MDDEVSTKVLQQSDSLTGDVWTCGRVVSWTMLTHSAQLCFGTERGFCWLTLMAGTVKHWKNSEGHF